MSAPSRAVARSRVTMDAGTASGVAANNLKKGDVLAAARFAGVQAAKSAAAMLPDTNPALLRSTSLDFLVNETSIDIEAVVVGLAGGGSGMEMPALSAAVVAALTIYDMCKSADRTMSIEKVSLVERSGDGFPDWSRT